MTEPTSAISAWESFYVIVGSSGGALIGLQFVVITLIAERRRLTTGGGVGAFATPTVVHLAGALTVSALMSAPWPSVTALSATVGLIGLVGLVYATVIVRRARQQTNYKPVFEDWLWYAALPCTAYAVLAIAALSPMGGATPLFAIGSSALGLLLIGIHNAWDTVTHIVVTQSESGTPPK
jgi:hypothetical protein